MTSDLGIRIRAEGSQARRELGLLDRKLQDAAKVARGANTATRKSAGEATMALTASRKAVVAFERSLASAEKRSVTFGLRGVEKIRAQERALKDQASAAGATAEQIRRIGRAYDTMADRAVAAARRAQTIAAGRQGVGGGVALGALAARGGAIAATAAGVFGGAGIAGRLIQRSAELADLPEALKGIAANTEVPVQRLRGLVGQLEELDFASVQAQRSVALLAQTRIPALLDKVSELGQAARNFSVISGNSVSEVFEGLVGGIVKEEVDILETQGLLLKFQTGYEKYAASIGKAATALTEEEKAISRLLQVLQKAQSAQGIYNRTLEQSGGALRNLRAEASRATDQVALLVEPAIVTGANALAAAFKRATEELKNLANVRADGDSLLATILKNRVAPALNIRTPGPAFDILGANTPERFFKAFGNLAFGADKFVGPSRSLAGDLDFVGPPSALRNAPARTPPTPAPVDAGALRRATQAIEDLARRGAKSFEDLAASERSLLELFGERRASLTGPGTPAGLRGGVGTAFGGSAFSERRFSELRAREALQGQTDADAVRRNQAFLGGVRELQAERLRVAAEGVELRERAELDSLSLISARTIREKIALAQRIAEVEAKYRAERGNEEIRALRQRAAAEISENPALAGLINARLANQVRSTVERTAADVGSIQARAAARAADLTVSEQERVFDDLKRQADGVFDALFLRTRTLGDFFKTTMLTALKSVVTNTTAGALAPLFGGVAGGRSGGGGLAGLLGFRVGSISRPGAPGGTPGFAGPVTSIGSGGVALGSAGGLGVGGLAGGLAGLAASGGLLAGGGLLALRPGGSNPFVRGAVGAGAGAGIGVGTVGLLSQLAPGLVASGPIGALVLGGAVGVSAALNALLPKAKGRLKKEVLSAYGVRVEDRSVLDTLLGISKVSGGIAAGIRTLAARELIEAFALATGQDIGSGIVARVQPAVFLQRGGVLLSEPTYFAGRAVAPDSPLPVFNVSAPQSSARRLDPGETRFVLMEALGAVTSPEKVAASSLEADKRSIGRSARYALGAEPTTVLR